MFIFVGQQLLCRLKPLCITEELGERMRFGKDGSIRLLAVLFACFTATSATARAQESSTLQISVIDSATDRPLLDTRVTLRTPTASIPLAQATVDSAGRVRFPRLAAGLVYVSIRRLGSIPRDTSVRIVGGVELVLTVRLQSLSNLLAAVQVTAENQCPNGYGRLARSAPFASLILAAIDSQLREPLAGTKQWHVVESRRLLNRDGLEVEQSELEWIASESPSLNGIARDTLESLGYSWRADSSWHFALPHPSIFATQEFERLHCFAPSPGEESLSREIRFVPSKARVPNQLSGRLIFAGEPVTIRRLDLFFRGAPKAFRDSAAFASMTFETTADARVQINGWRVSTPAQSPHDRDPRAPALGSNSDGELRSRIEYRTQIRVDSTAGASLWKGETFRVVRKETQSQCAAWSAAECLQYGITSLRKSSVALNSPGAHAAIGYLASACSTGPLPVGDSDVPFTDPAWVHQPPRALPDKDARAYLGPFWDESRAVPTKFHDAMAKQVQLEACARLYIALATDTLLVTNAVPREGLAEWTCANGEAVTCVQHGLTLRRGMGSRHTNTSLDSVAADRFLERGCFLRAALACRLLAERRDTFDAERSRVSRLKGDTTTEPAARLLQSLTLGFLASPSSVSSGARSELATALRASFSSWSANDVHIMEHSGGVLITLLVSDPDRITANLLRPGTEAMVDSLGALLATRANLRALIVVHSDSAWLPVGSLPRTLRNRQIRDSDERRVDAWNARLLRAGADSRRLRVQAAGDGEPLFSNLSRLGQQLNRRVEIALRLQ